MAHLSIFQIFEETQLFWHEHEQRPAPPVPPTSSTPNTMNVFLGIIRRIILDDPVYSRYVKTTSCHICTQQYALLCLTELKERGGTLLLLLLAMDVLDRDINVVEQLTAGEERTHQAELRGMPTVMQVIRRGVGYWYGMA